MRVPMCFLFLISAGLFGQQTELQLLQALKGHLTDSKLEAASLDADRIFSLLRGQVAQDKQVQLGVAAAQRLASSQGVRPGT